jgi:hypothetical protein
MTVCRIAGKRHPCDGRHTPTKLSAVVKPIAERTETSMQSRTHRAGDEYLPMTGGNLGFVVEKLGQDCPPLQYIRELTQNAIEAIRDTGEAGEVIWDVDWIQFDLKGIRKLCVIDTGKGMTGAEMKKYINQLSASSSEQSFVGNFGMGAKIAAASRNPAGVVYLSWKDGEGSMIQFQRFDRDKDYGLKLWETSGGGLGDYLAIADEVKPDLIKRHGTKVVLHGGSEMADTMEPPKEARAPTRWIAYYLNTRYFRFPEGVAVKAREGWKHPRTDSGRNKLRTVTGQGPFLDSRAVARDVVQLTGAKAHWWILSEGSGKDDSSWLEETGHVAALYQNELYEMTVLNRGGRSKLQNFGVTHGSKQVVIYIEPTNELGPLSANTTRTALLINNEPLPWADWADEFRQLMPEALSTFVNSKAPASDPDQAKSIRDRLKSIMSLFKVSRYKPSVTGAENLDMDNDVSGGAPRERSTPPNKRSHSGTSGGPGGTGGNVYALFTKPEGPAGSSVAADIIPDPTWVSARNGTREDGEMDDRAASYVRHQNMVKINEDFRVFTDLVALFEKEYQGVPGSSDVIRDVAKQWYAQAIVETIIGVQGLVNSKAWKPDHIDSALSDEALTVAVMQRYHVFNAMKRELGSKLGSSRS